MSTAEEFEGFAGLADRDGADDRDDELKRQT
jgi:hypothetical protein